MAASNIIHTVKSVMHVVLDTGRVLLYFTSDLVPDSRHVQHLNGKDPFSERLTESATYIRALLSQTLHYIMAPDGAIDTSSRRRFAETNLHSLTTSGLMVVTYRIARAETVKTTSHRSTTRSRPSNGC